MTAEKRYCCFNDEELLTITSIIKNRYGIDFTGYEKKSLRRSFARIMGKCRMDSKEQLMDAVLGEDSSFFNSINDLTVNRTELFRNPELWETLEQDILQKLQFKQEINIWHAGCSSGEEVYSMALVLEKNNLLHKTRTLATDISTKALEKARSGKYSNTLISRYEKSLRQYQPLGQIEELFHIDDHEATIRDRYKAHVEFKYHNLVSDYAQEKFDIIFCRNVMLYFNDPLKLAVIERLRHALKDNGFLILGYYDVLPTKADQHLAPYSNTMQVFQARTRSAIEVEMNNRLIGFNKISA